MLVNYKKGFKAVRASLGSRPAFYAPLALGVVFMLVLIVHYGVNTPFWDQWEMVPLFQSVDNHTLTFHQLWMQHNEHRVLFPNIVLLIAAYITHWHTGVEILIGLGLATITATLLFTMLGRSFRNNGLRLFVASLVAAWFFSPVQWENWSWGWQVEWFMCIAATVASLYLLVRLVSTNSQRSKQILLGLACITGLIGTYSLAGGQLVWPVGLILLLISRQKKQFNIAWAAVGVLAIAVYYHNYVNTPSPSGSSLHVVFHNPVGFVQFFLVYLGGPVAASPNLQTLTLVFGTILVLALVPLLYLLWPKRKALQPYLPWLCLMLLGLLADVSTAYGRLGFGVGFAASSRYTAYSSLYLIGLIVTAFLLLENQPKLTASFRRLSSVVALVVLVPMLVTSYAVGIHGFRDHSTLLKEIKSCTHEPDPTNACLSLTYPDPAIVRPRLEFLKAKHWAGY
jgi:hypothetical protein